MRRGAKRKTTHKGEPTKKPAAGAAEEQKNEPGQSTSQPTDENHLQESLGNVEPEPSNKSAAKGRRKRVMVTKPETETEYFLEKRNLWDQLDTVYQYKWNFSNLEDAFEEGGELHNKTAYLFEKIISLVYAMYHNKDIAVLRPESSIGPFPGSEQSDNDSCCGSYFYNPFQEEIKQSTLVSILYPIDHKPVICEFDWDSNELEEFTDKHIEEEELSEDQKEPFKDFVREKVREAKKANREAREARKKALAEMNETRAVFDNMQFYKFYPVSTPDTPPDVSKKSPFINRYYGKASKVL
ncbi:hypothetical protein PHJA_000304900 [Phtheirospermum japonicum]|uniref:Uncharacterized protein n=1 Tax=Phtheirospermum japonicum TaxID=374723 RepID=A0A830B437_9LAMI|nr:hypothetical protein PHJA_000304900 [Phtheirospermum japonicum]